MPKNLEISVLSHIDHELTTVDFDMVSQLTKARKFGIKMNSKLTQSLMENFNLPLKQYFINIVNLFKTYPKNQNNLTGFMSYMKIHRVFRNMNFNLFKLGNEEVEHILY